AGGSAFDCSGLTSWTYLRHGFALPRTAQQQYSFIAARGHINHNLNTLRPGDLVFFSPSGSPNNIVHVGIALGNGKMIHAARPGVGVVIGNIYAGFIGGGRP
ncbi:C40 family peptidase, partial [Arcanobacterium bovis]